MNCPKCSSYDVKEILDGYLCLQCRWVWEVCKRCKNQGWYWVANGPDDMDKEPCEYCDSFDRKLREDISG